MDKKTAIIDLSKFDIDTQTKEKKYRLAANDIQHLVTHEHEIIKIYAPKDYKGSIRILDLAFLDAVNLKKLIIDVPEKLPLHIIGGTPSLFGLMEPELACDIEAVRQGKFTIEGIETLKKGHSSIEAKPIKGRNYPDELRLSNIFNSGQFKINTSFKDCYFKNIFNGGELAIESKDDRHYNIEVNGTKLSKSKVKITSDALWKKIKIDNSDIDLNLKKDSDKGSTQLNLEKVTGSVLVEGNADLLAVDSHNLKAEFINSQKAKYIISKSKDISLSTESDKLSFAAFKVDNLSFTYKQKNSDLNNFIPEVITLTETSADLDIEAKSVLITARDSKVKLKNLNRYTDISVHNLNSQVDIYLPKDTDLNPSLKKMPNDKSYIVLEEKRSDSESSRAIYISDFDKTQLYRDNQKYNPLANFDKSSVSNVQVVNDNNFIEDKYSSYRFSYDYIGPLYLESNNKKLEITSDNKGRGNDESVIDLTNGDYILNLSGDHFVQTEGRYYNSKYEINHSDGALRFFPNSHKKHVLSLDNTKIQSTIKHPEEVYFTGYNVEGNIDIYPYEKDILVNIDNNNSKTLNLNLHVLPEDKKKWIYSSKRIIDPNLDTVITEDFIPLKDGRNLLKLSMQPVERYIKKYGEQLFNHEYNHEGYEITLSNPNAVTFLKDGKEVSLAKAKDKSLFRGLYFDKNNLKLDEGSWFAQTDFKGIIYADLKNITRSALKISSEHQSENDFSTIVTSNKTQHLNLTGSHQIYTNNNALIRHNKGNLDIIDSEKSALNIYSNQSNHVMVKSKDLNDLISLKSKTATVTTNLKGHFPTYLLGNGTKTELHIASDYETIKQTPITIGKKSILKVDFDDQYSIFINDPKNTVLKNKSNQEVALETINHPSIQLPYFDLNAEKPYWNDTDSHNISSYINNYLFEDFDDYFFERSHTVTSHYSKAHPYMTRYDGRVKGTHSFKAPYILNIDHTCNKEEKEERQFLIEEGMVDLSKQTDNDKIFDEHKFFADSRLYLDQAAILRLKDNTNISVVSVNVPQDPNSQPVTEIYADGSGASKMILFGDHKVIDTDNNQGPTKNRHSICAHGNRLDFQFNSGNQWIETSGPAYIAERKEDIFDTGNKTDVDKFGLKIDGESRISIDGDHNKICVSNLENYVSLKGGNNQVTYNPLGQSYITIDQKEGHLFKASKVKVLGQFIDLRRSTILNNTRYDKDLRNPFLRPGFYRQDIEFEQSKVKKSKAIIDLSSPEDPMAAFERENRHTIYCGKNTQEIIVLNDKPINKVMKIDGTYKHVSYVPSLTIEGFNPVSREGYKAQDGLMLKNKTQLDEQNFWNHFNQITHFVNSKSYKDYGIGQLPGNYLEIKKAITKNGIDGRQFFFHEKMPEGFKSMSDHMVVKQQSEKSDLQAIDQPYPIIYEEANTYEQLLKHPTKGYIVKRSCYQHLFLGNERQFIVETKEMEDGGTYSFPQLIAPIQATYLSEENKTVTPKHYVTSKVNHTIDYMVNGNEKTLLRAVEKEFLFRSSYDLCDKEAIVSEWNEELFDFDKSYNTHVDEKFNAKKAKEFFSKFPLTFVSVDKNSHFTLKSGEVKGKNIISNSSNFISLIYNGKGEIPSTSSVKLRVSFGGYDKKGNLTTTAFTDVNVSLRQ